MKSKIGPFASARMLSTVSHGLVRHTRLVSASRLLKVFPLDPRPDKVRVGGGIR